MALTQTQLQIIDKCKKSCVFFLSNFGKIKHASAGILPFSPFNYQKEAIKSFRTHRFNIFRKCRQSGISKISGAFATWYAMFNNHKTILIVSRKEDDAVGFMREHVVFLYENLPDWMVSLWKPVKLNESEIKFPNGSRIRSLTSHPDVLRSHSASLNIIDEAAFIPNMDQIWAAGYPTLQHGGAVIVISTTAGIGNWYWSTMTDAQNGLNPFNPIVINWWDMDWAIEYTDVLSGQKRRIAPLDGIRPCVTKSEIAKYGKYWSPWLEEQYRALQAQGEAWKFEQEILADFVGSGNTVLDKNALAQAQLTVRDPIIKVTGSQTYIHPTTGVAEDLSFDFPDEHGTPQGLWIWEKPVQATPEKRKGNVVIQYGSPAHSYVMGVDIASGQGNDFSAIEVWDVDTKTQVAEFMARVLPRELLKYIDRIGRYYNCALAVVERNNGGDIIISQLRHEMGYPNLWRHKDINDKPQPGKRRRPRALKVSQYGHFTSLSSKPVLNKFLIDYIRDAEDNTWVVQSARLMKQLYTYVRKRDRSGRDTGRTEAEDGTGNYDDLVMATALAFVATGDAIIMDSSNLLPTISTDDFKSMDGPTILSDSQRVQSINEFIIKGGQQVLSPIAIAPIEMPDVSAQKALDEFTQQLGSIPSVGGKPIVTSKKFYYRRKN